MLKVFISQPMRGRDLKSIQNERNKILNLVAEELDDSIMEIPSFMPNKYMKYADKPVYMLSMAIKLLSDADVVVFAPGWDEARGCRIEHEICDAYKIPYKEFNTLNF